MRSSLFKKGKRNGMIGAGSITGVVDIVAIDICDTCM
jgi:hypothetical protein